MQKIGLILEGGSMRGLFTAGVIDVFMENNIEIDTIIGVSAGALFGVNYFSNQPGRVIRYSKRFSKDRRYISILSWLFTGNVVNRKFAYYKVPKKLDVLDFDKFRKSIKSGKEFYATVTNVENGKPEYISITDADKDLDVFCATSALPLASKIVSIDGKKYLDGGISDPIPIEEMQKMGCDKIIVILTQPLDYKKTKVNPKKLKYAKKKLGKYKNLIKTMEDRHLIYNNKIKLINELSDKGQIFVIRPNKSLNIKLIERDPKKLDEIYNEGILVGRENIDKLQKYLSK